MARVSALYKNNASYQLSNGIGGVALHNFDQLSNDQKGITTRCYVDCATAVFDVSPTKRLFDRGDCSNGTTIPVLFVPWETPTSSDNLLTCFGALALAQITGTLPTIGTIIYSDAYCRKTVKIENYVTRTMQIIEAIKAFTCADNAPTLLLNRHCGVCDFQQRCRGIAVERDDLSLLTAMTAKERGKCAAKGIFTITQLSYGYRPRRAKRTRSKNSATRATQPPKMITS